MAGELKILVCIKQVADSNSNVQLVNGIPAYDEKTVFVLNRYDEYALEEALQLKDCGMTSHIHTISVGPQRILKALRRSIEMGADEAFHIINDDDTMITPLLVAHVISQFAQQNYDIIFTGVMSEDAMNQQTGQLIAALLGYDHATGVTELSIKEKFVSITRDLDAQQSMQYELQIPCVISVQSSIHKPRYPSLSNVLRARKQEIKIIKPESVMSIKKTHCYFTMPQKTTQCQFIEGSMAQQIYELYNILHKNAVL